MSWTLTVRKGKEVNYLAFDTMDQMNQILKREYGINIEYIETEAIKKSNL